MSTVAAVCVDTFFKVVLQRLICLFNILLRERVGIKRPEICYLPLNRYVVKPSSLVALFCPSYRILKQKHEVIVRLRGAHVMGPHRPPQSIPFYCSGQGNLQHSQRFARHHCSLLVYEQL